MKFGTRYYDPTLGRWIQQDPSAGSIANSSTVDRYTYVGDDPIESVDSSGRDFWPCNAALVATTLGALGIIAAVAAAVTAPVTILVVLALVGGMGASI